MNIIAISGKAGAGKDTIADYLVREHGFVKIGLADPMKRFCKEIFGFSDEQLWGPSEKRNAPDERFPRLDDFERANLSPDVTGPDYLTPRYALQRLGTEWGRDCHKDVWIRYALWAASELLLDGWMKYTAERGLYYGNSEWAKPRGVVISDARFENELEAVRAAGGKLWRVVRPSLESDDVHVSETEQEGIPDDYFDVTFRNVHEIRDLLTCVEMRVLYPDNAA